jgi:signal peptidase I
MIRPDAPPKSAVRDYFETIVICVIFVLYSRAFVFQQSKIPTGSMEDTLLIGDYIMVNKFVYSPALNAIERALLPFQDVRRGDVIVFKFPEEPEKDYIKRIIGLPGEMIEIVDQQVHINGKPLEEPYKAHKDPHSRAAPGRRGSPLGEGRDNYGPELIPAASFFAMGDNRDNSRDSRSWGPVPRDNIKGRAFIIWWSFEERRNQYLETGFLNQFKHLLEKMTHLITKTRWSRTFHIIA